MTRRDALKRVGQSLGGATTVAAAAAFAIGGCHPQSGATSATPAEHVDTPKTDRLSTNAPATAARMPAVYLPHGGGPWPFMDTSRMGPPGMYDAMTAYLKGLPSLLPTKPKALLVVSAHWEESLPTIMSAAQPPMLYDYNGFPPETYAVKWPAPGAPILATRIGELLSQNGISHQDNRSRGFDHGVFVPLSLAWPTAPIPTLQLSLKRGLDPAFHLAMGKALAPLRDEGVFIIGSGMSYHNMQGFFGRVPSAAADAAAFDSWLAKTCRQPAATRNAELTRWSAAPAARACHPREEHLLPLMVIAGAAEEAATLPYQDTLMKVRISAVHFG